MDNYDYTIFNNIFYIIYQDIKNIDIPTVYIASKLGTYYKYTYGIVIIFAIFTSAIAAGYGFINNITQDKRKQKKINLLICLTAILVSQIGFSNLVNYMYPIFGMFSAVQIFLILLL